jgi:DNA replication protein DnaC
MAELKYEQEFESYLQAVKEIDTAGFAEMQTRRDNYFKKINEAEIKDGPQLNEIDPTSVYEQFKIQFTKTNGIDFDEKINNGESKTLAYTLILYFLENERFLKSPLLSNISEKSIKKGLLVIGGYGCGKTAIFKTIHELFLTAQNSPNLSVYTTSKVIVLLGELSLKFGYKTANQLIDEFEECETPADKESYWRKNTKYFSYYDDVLTERMASNYGKVDIFTELLQKRNAAGSRTMISCNYADGKGLEDSLKQFGTRYGGRVYDRLFEMFNVIELKGNSLRK